MLDHPIIDVAIGLIFFYVILSLVCSAVQEWIASLTGLRAKNLKAGIENLIGSDYAELLYEHPIIKGLRKPSKLPSYIKPETFTLVLLEIVAQDKAQKSYTDLSADELKATIEKIGENNPARELLLTLVEKGDDAVGDLKLKLAGWFDEGMERIGGWYKRQVKFYLFVIAAVVTISINADTLRIAEVLWTNDALRSAISAQAQKAAGASDIADISDPKAVMTQLKAFPIGWTKAPTSVLDVLKLLVGWLLTVAAVSMGAPFWFDLLSKVARLRASGGKPQDK